MTSTLGRYVTALLGLDESRTPPDLVVLSGGLVVIAFSAFWVSFLTQFGGPVTDGLLGPQTIAALTWGGFGTLFLILAALIYRCHPIGWYGTLATAGVLLFDFLRTGAEVSPLNIAILLTPILVGGILFFRRDRFFE